MNGEKCHAQREMQVNDENICEISNSMTLFSPIFFFLTRDSQKLGDSLY